MRENQGKEYTLILFINSITIFSKVFSKKNYVWWITQISFRFEWTQTDKESLFWVKKQIEVVLS